MVYFLLGIVIFEAVIIMNLKKEVTVCKMITSNYKELIKNWWNVSSLEEESR